MRVTLEQLFACLGGQGDPATNKVIRQQLQDPDSVVSKTLQGVGLLSDFLCSKQFSVAVAARPWPEEDIALDDLEAVAPVAATSPGAPSPWLQVTILAHTTTEQALRKVKQSMDVVCRLIDSMLEQAPGAKLAGHLRIRTKLGLPEEAANEESKHDYDNLMHQLEQGINVRWSEGNVRLKLSEGKLIVGPLEDKRFNPLGEFRVELQSGTRVLWGGDSVECMVGMPLSEVNRVLGEEDCQLQILTYPAQKE